MTNPGNENAVVATLAAQATDPHALEPGTIYAVPKGDGSVGTITTDDYAHSPRRTVAARTVSDSESFVAYLEKHGLDETEIYADTPSSSIVAIIDSHRGALAAPSWQQHRLTLKLQHTKSWIAWNEHDGTWFTQTDFAEFIEQRASDVKTPSAGDLMGLAQSFYMTTDVEYESSERLDNGETRLVYKEKVATRGLNNTEVPKELELVLQPYVDSPRQYGFARLRTKLVGSALRIGYVLIRPEEILDGVFADIVTEIRDGREASGENRAITPVKHPIYFGKP